ncbi:MAG: agmatine deiminase family protein [Alphaproteobacteria bacterium]
MPHPDALYPNPARDGYFMPAEWEQHRRTWMCWPARAEPFGGAEGLLRAKQAYARVARVISAFEHVTIAAKPDEAAEARLATGGKAEVVEMPLDDGWARDSGPTFLISAKGGLAGVHWRFNAWGNKYHPHANDAAFGARALKAAGAAIYEAPIVCEGGAIHCDGKGTMLTTEQCLLNANRNPGTTREKMEEHLSHFLGARKVIWLGNGFSDDETDGHVDNIACFAAPGHVIVGVPPKSHPDHEPALDALRRLKAARDAGGKAFEIIELAQPQKTRTGWNGKLLQASYVNFYLPNGALVMPAFGDVNDERARVTLAACFPGRDIMQVDALDIVQGGGGIHCITQQEPRV